MGSIWLRLLFLTLLPRGLTGQHIIPSDGEGAGKDLSGRGSARS
jgi:hypothetical protein